MDNKEIDLRLWPYNSVKFDTDKIAGISNHSLVLYHLFVVGDDDFTNRTICLNTQSDMLSLDLPYNNTYSRPYIDFITAVFFIASYSSMHLIFDWKREYACYSLGYILTIAWKLLLAWGHVTYFISTNVGIYNANIFLHCMLAYLHYNSISTCSSISTCTTCIYMYTKLFCRSSFASAKQCNNKAYS